MAAHSSTLGRGSLVGCRPRAADSDATAQRVARAWGSAAAGAVIPPDPRGRAGPGRAGPRLLP